MQRKVSITIQNQFPCRFGGFFLDQSDFRVGEQSPYSPLCATNLYQCKAAYQTIEDSSEKTIKQCLIQCVCACIILRHRSQQMNTLKKIVSLILHRGGASKQVELLFLPLLIYFTIMFHTGKFISAYRDCYYALAINMSSISLTSWEGIMIQMYSTGWKPYRGQ